MRQRGSDRLPRLVSTASRWSVGSTIGALRHLRNRRHVVHEVRYVDTLDLPDFHRELPGGSGRLKRPDRGRGPFYHRTYTLEVDRPGTDAVGLMAELVDDPNRACPTEYARFEPRGAASRMEVGTEHVVRLPGPRQGPVRVVDRTPTSFRLVTLRGHVEAGEIEFRTADSHDGLVVTIESWARSGDVTINLLYTVLGLGQELQLAMWVHFLRRAARIAGGTPRLPVEVTTEVRGQDR